MKSSELIRDIISPGFEKDFESFAIRLARHQGQNNLLYYNYAQALKIAPGNIKSLLNIPFLPISFFKSHEVKTGEFDAEAIFTSSGTTGMQTSRHFVQNLDVYEKSFVTAFRKFYGEPADYCILGLLPSYLERTGSSLILMVEKLIALSGHPDSGFFLYEHEELASVLARNSASGQKSLLIGVTFALLDFAEKFPAQLENTVIMETGGMKGRGEEITRVEVADKLKLAFGQQSIHSEYGMTELLSQAYSKGNGVFKCPPWMRVLVRDTSDPLAVAATGRGALNIIDLANMDSCAFIATQDLGIVHEDGSFEVTGRMDHSDVRGCNLLVL